MITENAYAKINLALEVNEKRSDGYHDVRNLMAPIELHDTLTFKFSDNINVTSNVNIENNFINKAARLFLDYYNINGGVEIHLDKRIPIEAGLAGGSSDASACLRGLNRLYNINAPLSELAKLSETLGSDMPFCVYQQLALCTGRGENVKLIDIKYPKYFCYLIKPKDGISTANVYKNYKKEVFNNKGEDKIQNIIKALKGCDIQSLNKNIFNDLTKSAISISSSLDSLKQKLQKSNYNFHLSGSGPTLFLISDVEIDGLDKIIGSDITYIKTILK